MNGWTTIRLRVDTPLFSGDNPGPDAGTIVRVPSIRGALRFWYRAVAAGHGLSDLKQLADSETEVFGSTKHQSPVRMRIASVPETTRRSAGDRPFWADHRKDGFSGAQYLLGQGLWDRHGLTRPCLEDGEVELMVRFDGDDPAIPQRFMLALWAWVTYGGLGARVRRGFGRLTVVDIDNPPEGWSTLLLSPGGDADTQLDRWHAVFPDGIREHARKAFPGGPPDDDAVPAFPVLSTATWFGHVIDNQPTIRPLRETLHEIGLAWRTFRNAAEAHNKPSPEWRSVVLGKGRDYPVAALGLPVNYFRKDPRLTAEVNLKTNGKPARRASPVWLTPVRAAGGYAAFTHIFYSELIPQNATIELSRGPRTLRSPDQETAIQAWDAWLDRQPRPQPERER